MIQRSCPFWVLGHLLRGTDRGECLEWTLGWQEERLHRLLFTSDLSYSPDNLTEVQTMVEQVKEKTASIQALVHSTVGQTLPVRAQS